MARQSVCDIFEEALIVARVAARAKVAADNAKVKTFLTILRSYLTQFDQKLESKGQPNLYRLGHYFGALEKIEAAVKSKLDDDDAEAMDALKAALKKNFESDFPPLKKILKLVDAWVNSKKLPKLGKM